MQHRPTLLNPTLLNEMLYNVERGDQTNATCLIQHLDSRVWDQNLPRILGKQTSAILLCTINGRRPIDLRSSDHLLAFRDLKVSLTPLLFLFLIEEWSLVFNLRRGEIQNFVRSPYCNLNTHAATCEANNTKTRNVRRSI